MIYIPKGEHDDPNEHQQQQDLAGSTKIAHTLYSHTDSISPKMKSFQKLEYIYQHFQDNALMQLGMKLRTLFTHILTTILNMVYLKML